MKQKLKKSSFQSLIFIAFVIIVTFAKCMYFDKLDLSVDKHHFEPTRFCQLTLGSLLMVFAIYFFILPQELIIGGLEALCLFLDKVFFYKTKEKKQNHWFSSNNGILFFRIFIILFGACFHPTWFFLLTLFVASLFSILFKILEYWRIDRVFLLNKFPDKIKNNILYRLSLSSVIIGVFIGIGAGLVIGNEASTGGTDFVFKVLHNFIKKYVTIEFPMILLIIDGSILVASFAIDYFRKIDVKKNIVIKYVFSIITFTIAISLITLVSNSVK
ncbi:YitT family protein [Candidatus Phytoplasma pruni]|uniref:YitT family protein n=1 Tax=Candidatus Phytoplasma pruni TaxID=479893 RepID=A0A851HC62_9MOLU|nr:YitT family protein [Candidatus Phytoplasma pruni]NWN45621.1 YitT family protein [Candidatus Phytoplasma pruni]